jgi:hypothetical protein
METLKLTTWQLLIYAMTLTSVAAFVALLLSMLLARFLTSLPSTAALIGVPKGSVVDKTLRWFD